MASMILDPKLESELIAQRAAWGGDRFDEVWEGVYMMSPLADNEHQALQFKLAAAIQNALGERQDLKICCGVNVSDREDGWEHNYRCPDVVVFAPHTTAKDCGTFWFGGPDFAVEITSPHDRSRDKFGFYANVKVRELLIVDRNNWTLDLYKLVDGELKLDARSTVDNGVSVSSDVLGLSLRLVPNRSGETRPAIEINNADGGRSWKI